MLYLLGAFALMCCSCMDPGAGHWQQAFGFRTAYGTNDRVAMVPTPVLGHLEMEVYFFRFFLFSSLVFVASVASVGVWLLWLDHALPIF